MQFTTASKDDIQQMQKLWDENFSDGTKGLCDFLFNAFSLDKFYIVKENETVVSMLIAATDLSYKNKKGFYMYSACTDKKFRGRGYMQGLVKFCLDDMKNRGYEFCVIKPTNEHLFDFYKNLGFDMIIKMRKADVEIKRNIWQSAEFDIATATRLKTIREKYCENIIQYTNKDYEKYAMYLYSFGGSTAESDDAFAIFYTDKDRLIVKEILSDNSVYAMKLLQAIREKTGCETATVYLSNDSTLFLGEGKLVDTYMIYGLCGEVPYVNLMIE